MKMWRQHFSGSDTAFRRALRMAIAMIIGVAIFRGFDLLQGFWVILTITIVMQATTAATLRKGLQRFVGTLIGILIGHFILIWVHNPIAIDVLLVLGLFVAYWLKSFNLVNYGIFVIPLTVMVVFLISAIVPMESTALTWACLYDSVIGVVISLLVTFIVLPVSVKPMLREHALKMKECALNYIESLNVYLKTHDDSNVVMHRLAYQNALTKMRELYADWRYEIWHNAKLKAEYKAAMMTMERYGQLLASLQYLLHQSVAEHKCTHREQALAQLKKQLMAIKLKEKRFFLESVELTNKDIQSFLQSF